MLLERDDRYDHRPKSRCVATFRQVKEERRRRREREREVFLSPTSLMNISVSGSETIKSAYLVVFILGGKEEDEEEGGRSWMK